MSKSKLSIGLLLVLVGIGLGIAAYFAHTKVLEAERKTLQLPSGFRGPLTPNTPVTVELFGPNRRAADSAASTRNALLTACAIVSFVGAAIVVITLVDARRKRGTNRQQE